MQLMLRPPKQVRASTRKTRKVFVGIKTHMTTEGLYLFTEKSIFRAAEKPEASALFNKVVGPFKTIRGAKVLMHFTWLQPNDAAIEVAEQIGKEYDEYVRALPTTVSRA